MTEPKYITNAIEIAAIRLVAVLDPESNLATMTIPKTGLTTDGGRVFSAADIEKAVTDDLHKTGELPSSNHHPDNGISITAPAEAFASRGYRTKDKAAAADEEKTWTSKQDIEDGKERRKPSPTNLYAPGISRTKGTGIIPK